MTAENIYPENQAICSSVTAVNFYQTTLHYFCIIQGYIILDTDSVVKWPT